MCPVKQKGIHPPQIKTRGDYSGNLREVPCTAGHERPGAIQIFPLFLHQHFRTPTVKHHCPRTAVAASLRACSNKVTPDKFVWEEYSNWFTNIFAKKFVGYLDNEHVTVDMDKWLTGGRYNKQYQEKMKRSFTLENRGRKRIEVYEAFAKIEMQFTNTLHELKDTAENDVKERQICGPSDEKKVMCNAFINELERIAHLYMKTYCGRKNWLEICSGIETWYQDITDPILGASDGSGFDMTQLKANNVLVYNLMKECARHTNVSFNEPLTKEDVYRALDVSETLKVSVDNGQLTYQADGRASGDGWTTFGNTLLMISYWEYAFYLSKIPDDKWRLTVKGDDVLFAVSAEYKSQLESSIKVCFTPNKHEHSHGLGQISKKIDWGQIEDLDFLSNHFFWTGHGKLRMTRIPPRVFQTNSWSTKAIHDPRLIPGLVYSKGKNLVSWGKGLPIWEVLGNKMMELGRFDSRVQNEYSDEGRLWNGNDDYLSYISYLEYRYGWDLRTVKEIEDLIKQITSLEGFVTLNALDMLYDA